MKKIVLASIIAVSVSSTTNAKQIIYCGSVASYPAPHEVVMCTNSDGNGFESSLGKLYKEGWRLVTSQVGQWQRSGSTWRGGYYQFYLEK